MLGGELSTQRLEIQIAKLDSSQGILKFEVNEGEMILGCLRNGDLVRVSMFL